MSTCISWHGEFSRHELDDEYTCKLCGVLDEEALRAELRELRRTNEGLREALAEDQRESLERTLGW